MPPAAPTPDLLRSLGRLVRGLSAVFWGLPASLVVCFHTARAESLKSFMIVPPLVCTGLLVYGLWQMGSFQRQERVWRNTLDLSQVLALINFGLSPFLFWSNRIPGNTFMSNMVLLMIASALLFLGSLNLVLQRLGAMLPDEGLRQETKQFSSLNLNLLFATFVIGAAYVALSKWPNPPLYWQAVMLVLDHGSFWLLVLLVLLPMAMTMALLWKTKEVILDNVFSAKS